MLPRCGAGYLSLSCDRRPQVAPKGAKDIVYDKEADSQGLWKVFQEFDEDGSGAVDASEMKLMVESLGMVVTKKDVQEMVTEADEDGSGEIEFAEFKKPWKP